MVETAGGCWAALESCGKSTMVTIRLPKDFQEVFALLNSERVEYLLVAGHSSPANRSKTSLAAASWSWRSLRLSRSFCTTSAGARSTKTGVGELLFLRGNEADELFDFLLLPRDLGLHVDQVGQIDVNVHARERHVGAEGRGRDVGPKAGRPGVGHRREIGLHRAQQFGDRGVAADGKRSGVFGATPCRARMSRTARSTSWNRANWASISASCRIGSHSGHGAIMTLSAAGCDVVDAPLRRDSASRCQTSSVRNGIIGCKQPQQRVERVGQHPLGHRPRDVARGQSHCPCAKSGQSLAAGP